MSVQIKNWAKFQHFKDRRPPWVKLYRDLLDDREWHKLDGDSAKLLVSLWLIGSEDSGNLPTVDELAFRLRLDEKHVEKCLKRLDHWLISERYQDDINSSQKISATDIEVPLRDREEERREETEAFDQFWSVYPKKVAKPAAIKAFKLAKINGHLPEVLADIEAKKQSLDWQKNDGQFVPNPATYLNQRRWEDGTTEQPSGMFAGAI